MRNAKLSFYLQRSFFITHMAPIHIAVMRNSVPGVKVLLGHEDINLNCQNDAGETPLFIACREDHVEVVKLLLESSKVDVNIGASKSITPLFIASTHGSYETSQLIVSRDDIREDIRTAEGVSLPFMFRHSWLLRIEEISKWLTFSTMP